MPVRIFNKKIIYVVLLMLNAIITKAQTTVPVYLSVPYPEKVFILKSVKPVDLLSNYFTSLIPASDVHCIIEIGGGDGIGALKLSEYYRCHVFVFECNPASFAACKKNIANQPNVTLVDLAAWNKTEALAFYPAIEPNAQTSTDVSSCFKVFSDGPYKKYTQGQINVLAIRLDEWIKRQQISAVHMLCIDAQGATMQVLEGVGNYLDKTKYIFTKLNHKRLYCDEALFPEIEHFLDEHGFMLCAGQIDRFSGNYLFINKCLIHYLYQED